jgi:hypothetical protein
VTQSSSSGPPQRAPQSWDEADRGEGIVTVHTNGRSSTLLPQAPGEDTVDMLLRSDVASELLFLQLAGITALGTWTGDAVGVQGGRWACVRDGWDTLGEWTEAVVWWARTRAGDQTYRVLAAPVFVALLDATLRPVLTFTVAAYPDGKRGLVFNAVALKLQAEGGPGGEWAEAVDLSPAVHLHAECMLAWKGVNVAPGLQMAQVSAFQQHG